MKNISPLYVQNLQRKEIKTPFCVKERMCCFLILQRNKRPFFLIWIENGRKSTILFHTRVIPALFIFTTFNAIQSREGENCGIGEIDGEYVLIRFLLIPEGKMLFPATLFLFWLRKSSLSLLSLTLLRGSLFFSHNLFSQSHPKGRKRITVHYIGCINSIFNIINTPLPALNLNTIRTKNIVQLG